MIKSWVNKITYVKHTRQSDVTWASWSLKSAAIGLFVETTHFGLNENSELRTIVHVLEENRQRPKNSYQVRVMKKWIYVAASSCKSR